MICLVIGFTGLRTSETTRPPGSCLLALFGLCTSHILPILCSLCILGVLPFSVAGNPLGPGVGAAQAPCGGSERSWVLLEFSGIGWDDRLRAAVQADLSAGLTTQGIDVCPATGSAKATPAAQVEMRTKANKRVVVVVSVSGQRAGSPLQREVDLAAIPEDGRGLSLALAADELLRSLGVEQTPQASEPTPAIPQPAQPTAPAAPPRSESPARPSQALSRIAAQTALAHHTAGLTFAGADVAFAYFPSQNLGLEAALGARHGIRRRSEHGAIETDAMTAAVSLLGSPFRRTAGTALIVRLGISLAIVQLRGLAHNGAWARDANETTAHAWLGLGVRQRLFGPLEVGLDVGIGTPLRSVTATDTGRVAAGTGGAQLRGDLGLGVRL